MLRWSFRLLCGHVLYNIVGIVAQKQKIKTEETKTFRFSFSILCAL